MPCDCIFGLARRLIASEKLRAVTACPFENLKPGLIVNVYVLPLLEMIGSPAATSGVAIAPAAPSLSGKFMSLQAAACSSFQVSP